jgi:hypothetical protein
MMKSDRAWLVIFTLSVFLSFLGCGGGGGGSDSGGGTGGTTPTPPAPTGSVSLTVSGTTITAFSGDEAVSSDSTQGKSIDVDSNGDGINDAYRLTLGNIPLNTNIRIYLESKGAVYPLYFSNGTGTTNVFSLGSETPFDFGFIALLKGAAGNSASPLNSPCAAGDGILCAAAIARIPAALFDPDTSGLSIEELNANGLNALNEGSIMKARTYFEAADQLAGTEASNRADTARFFYAATTVLAFGFDRLSDNTSNGLNNLGDILDSFGMNSTDDVRINAEQYPIPAQLPSTAARGADIQTFTVEKILPELLKAKAAADKISSGFNVIWTEPLVNESVESDYGDALLCRTALNGILAALYAQAAYDLDSDLAAKANENQTVAAFLAANPSFGTIKAGASANLSQSRSYARSGLLNLQGAITAMESETDDQSNDYVSLADLLPEDIAQAKADIADALGSLDGPTVVADNKNVDKRFTLDLSPFFAGSIVSLRALLPAFSGNDVFGPFPDTKMGGTFTAGPEVNLDDTAPANNIPDILEESGETTLQFTGWPYR